MNWQKLKRRLESRNLVLCLRVMKLLRKELRTNRLLDLKDLWVVSRIQAQVMATLATNARAGKTDAELARLRELMDKTPDEFREMNRARAAARLRVRETLEARPTEALIEAYMPLDPAGRQPGDKSPNPLKFFPAWEISPGLSCGSPLSSAPLSSFFQKKFTPPAFYVPLRDIRVAKGIPFSRPLAYHISRSQASGPHRPAHLCAKRCGLRQRAAALKSPTTPRRRNPPR